MYYSANYPDILIGNLDINPSIYSPNAGYSIQFALTADQRYDFEEYQAVLDSAINNFRKSKFYKHYKSYLYSLGLDCCQFHPHIHDDMASLEMHHCMLNIYDIGILIAEHLLNTIGSLTEFDLDDLLRLEHSENNIPIAMLCKDCHTRYHHKFLYVHPDMIFGTWWKLFEKYNQGLTREIAEKVLRYLNNSIGEKYEKKQNYMEELLALRNNLANWSDTTRGLVQHGHDIKYGVSTTIGSIGEERPNNDEYGKEENKHKDEVAEYVGKIQELGG